MLFKKPRLFCKRQQCKLTCWLKLMNFLRRFWEIVLCPFSCVLFWFSSVLFLFQFCLFLSAPFYFYQFPGFPYKNFFILFVFYTYYYHTYFNPILILSGSILLLFSLIRKIGHLFYCCFAFIETLFYKQWSILSLFYYTKPQNSPQNILF